MGSNSSHHNGLSDPLLIPSSTSSSQDLFTNLSHRECCIPTGSTEDSYIYLSPDKSPPQHHPSHHPFKIGDLPFENLVSNKQSFIQLLQQINANNLNFMDILGWLMQDPNNPNQLHPLLKSPKTGTITFRLITIWFEELYVRNVKPHKITFCSSWDNAFQLTVYLYQTPQPLRTTVTWPVYLNHTTQIIYSSRTFYTVFDCDPQKITVPLINHDGFVPYIDHQLRPETIIHLPPISKFNHDPRSTFGYNRACETHVILKMYSHPPPPSTHVWTIKHRKIYKNGGTITINLRDLMTEFHSDGALSPVFPFHHTILASVIAHVNNSSNENTQ